MENEFPRVSFCCARAHLASVKDASDPWSRDYSKSTVIILVKMDLSCSDLFQAVGYTRLQGLLEVLEVCWILEKTLSSATEIHTKYTEEIETTFSSCVLKLRSGLVPGKVEFESSISRAFLCFGSTAMLWSVNRPGYQELLGFFKQGEGAKVGEIQIRTLFQWLLLQLLLLFIHR